jgi:hypothetical protein
VRSQFDADEPVTIQRARMWCRPAV